MQKYDESSIKPFQFSEINSSHVVEQPKFTTFNFQNIEGQPVNTNKVSDDTIRQERNFAARNNFKVDDIVSNARGLTLQEKNDLEKKINDEVQKRLELAYQDAYREGLEKGRAEGHEESLRELQQVVTQRMEELNSLLTEVQQQSTQLLDKNRQEVYEFIKRFTKWIVLKEVNEKTYLETLLEKLILELNARKNLIIKVGKANFSQMPEVVAAVESRLGQLSNVRIEIVPEISYPGIILEAENGLIDGSLEGVFQNIDKIFELVVTSE